MSDLTSVSAPKGAKKAFDDLLRKMYISNVAKRLRDLDQPSATDKQRWVWELIQNAKDTIANDNTRDKINVSININGDIVTFTHDGNPFTLNARLGLLWKYSEAKETQESTGRFGTGFLTTHCLSKIVSIESDVYDDDDFNNVLGFRVTMYRDGDTESELLEGLDKMESSEVYFKESFGHTSFTYHIKSDSGREAVRLGIENFYNNIAQTMLFCPELNSVVINNNGSLLKVERGDSNNLTADIKEQTIIFTGEINQTRRFISTSLIKESPELTARYKNARNMRLQTAIEIDGENNIIPKGKSCGFYCVLPLVGIENQLDEPIYVNCPDFEPDSERQSLMLNGQTFNEEKGHITEVGINRLIYADILAQYERLLSYAVTSNFGNPFYMIQGLKRAKNHEKLDQEWYKSEVVQNYRNLALQQKMAKVADGEKIRLTDAIIIKESKNEDEKELLNLVAQIYPSEVLEDNHKWAEEIWNNGDLRVWNLEDFCRHISETYSNWKNIPLVSGEDISTWYNAFLSVVAKRNDSLLSEYALLPDINGTLHKRDGSLKENVGVSDIALNILAKLGKDKSSDILNSNITAVSLEGKYTTTSAAHDINECAREITQNNGWLTKLMPLMAIVPTDAAKYPNQTGFCEKRKAFFEIAKNLFGLEEEETNDNSLTAASWEVLDERFRKAVVAKLHELQCVDNLPQGLGINWLNDTLKVIEPTSNQWDNYAVVPNQYGNFRKKEDLYIDLGIEAVLKDDIFKPIGVDVKKFLLHTGIDAKAIGIGKEWSTTSLVGSIRDRFMSSNNPAPGYHNIGHRYYKYSKETLLPIARYLLGILPSWKESETYESQENFREIVDILSDVSVPFIGNINYSESNLWDIPNKLVADSLFDVLESDATIEGINYRLGSIGTQRVYEYLNDLYSSFRDLKLEKTSAKIYPNQNDKLCALSALSSEYGEIDEILKDVAANLPGGTDYREELLHKNAKVFFERTISRDQVLTFIDNKIVELFEAPSNWREEAYKNNVTLFIEGWAKNNESTFKDKCPKTEAQKDAITVNVIITPEIREKLQAIVRTGTDIALIEKAHENAEKVAYLEEENAKLKAEIEKLYAKFNLLNRSTVVSVGDDDAGLSKELQQVYLDEAKDMILEDLKNSGYDISQAIWDDYTKISGVRKIGSEKAFPVVFRSNKSHRNTIISPLEWDTLMEENAMFGVVTDGMVKKYDLRDILSQSDNMTIRFSTKNCDIPERLDKLSQAFRYFKGIQFDFDKFIAPTHLTWQNFFPPELNTSEKPATGNLELF
ncbi:MAG: hypothetical protein HDT28_07480 [Clostridiales bacterium]|nr:hypothetical protein [Clostridiales bacterium]